MGDEFGEQRTTAGLLRPWELRGRPPERLTSDRWRGSHTTLPEPRGRLLVHERNPHVHLGSHGQLVPEYSGQALVAAGFYFSIANETSVEMAEPDR